MFQPTKARRRPMFFMVAMAALFLIVGQARGALAVTVTTDMEGGLVKGSAADVYFLGADAKRYIFPNEKVFFSWYKDFSTVQVISDADLAAQPIGGNVVFRPGTRLVKIPSDPKVYAVASDGTLRWVSTEDLAKSIFGDSWVKQINEVPPSYLDSYQTGAPIEKTTDYRLPTDGQTPATASAGATSVGNNVNPPTAPSPAGVSTAAFKILSVDVLSVDATGAAAEDARTFRIAYSKAPTGARLTIIEKNTGATFYSEPVPKGDGQGLVAYVLPSATHAKLRPKTTYGWKVVAYAAPNATADQIATASGEFTTIDFTLTNSPPASVGTPAAGSGPETTPSLGGAGTSTADGAVSITPFKITAITLDKVDAQGNAAEDVRSFGVAMNQPAKSVRVTIAEKATGVQFYAETYPTTAATMYISPGKWPAKLKANTSYLWNIIAYAAGSDQSATKSGDFTTANFTATTNAVSNTTTPPVATLAASTLKIISVSVDRLDALGNRAEDVRSFGINFSAPAKNGRLRIVEKGSGLVFYAEPIAGGGPLTQTTYISPGAWRTKLIGNTTYAWMITAYAANAPDTEGPATATGEFTTSAF